ncbi:MAG TPA: hypothetical protein VMZ51_08105 [Acidimicrobiales bacterium]|nr:hypothetical protein [Acidimicrobiales bacterium]
MNKKLLADLSERAFWTAVEAAVAYLLVQSADWSGEWVPIVGACLSVLKGIIASKIGAKGTASTLPAHLDTTVVGL